MKLYVWPGPDINSDSGPSSSPQPVMSANVVVPENPTLPLPRSEIGPS